MLVNHLLLIIIGPIIASASNNYYDSRYDSLIHWLKDLCIILPDEDFHKGIFSVSIKNLTCSDFALRSLESSYQTPEISFSMYGTSASCVGTYRSGITSGSVYVHVTSNSSSSFDDDNIISEDKAISLLLAFPSSDYDLSSSINMRIPISSNVTECLVQNLQIPNNNGIYFSGSISAAIIELFAGMIASRVTHSMTNSLCPVLSTGFTNILNQHVIQPVNDYLIPLITNHSQDDGHLMHNTTWIQWEPDVPVLKSALLKLNHFISNHMDRGFLLSWLDYIHDECPCGYFFHGVHGWLEQMSPYGNGTFYLPTRVDQPWFHFPVEIPQYGRVHIYGLSIEITGLTTIDSISLAYPLVSSQTLDMLWNISATEGLDVTAGFMVRIQPESQNQDKVLEENFTTHIQLSNFTFSAWLQSGIDKAQFEQIVLGDILNQPTLLSKFWIPLLGLKKFHVSHLIIDTQIQHITIHPLQDQSWNHTLEDDCDELFNTFTDMILQEFSTYVSKAIYALTDGPWRQRLNELAENFIHNATNTVGHGRLYELNTFPSHEIERFTQMKYTSSFIPIYNWNSSNLSLDRLNVFIQCVVQSIASAYIEQILPWEIVNLWKNELIVTLNTWAVDNIGKINKIELLGFPEYNLKGALDALQWENDDPDNVQTLVSFTLEVPSLLIYSELNLTLSMFNLSSEFLSRIEYDTDTLEQLLLHQIMKNSSTLFAHFELFQILYWISHLEQGQLNYDLNIVLGTIASDTIQINGTQPIASLFNLVTNALLDVSTSFINSFIGYKTRHHFTALHADDFGNLWMSYVVFTLVMICFALLHVIYLRRSTIPRMTRHQQPKALTEPQFSFPEEAKKQLSTSLLFHPSINLVSQYLVPLMIIGTIFIFISSNLSTGASLNLIFDSLDGSNVSVPNLVIFTLGHTVAQMYHAGVYILMSLVLLFSGVWPYIKLLLLLYIWFCPDDGRSWKRRERILSFLDTWGKYSLVDSFVLVLMLVSFHLRIEALGSWSTFVTPDFGFYSFLLATVLSLLSGHYVVYLHRKSIDFKDMAKSSYFDDEENIWDYLIQQKKYRRIYKCVWMGTLCLCIITLIVGFRADFIIFEFKGLVASFLTDRIQRYSLISLGRAISESAVSASAGIVLIQWTYFFFTIVMPIVTLTIFALLFHVPMTLGHMQNLVTLAEVCMAWSALDVFLVSILASLLELSTFAKFMVGRHCDFLNPILSQVADGKETCFEIKTSIGWNSAPLILGIIVSGVFTTVSLKVAHLVLDDPQVMGGVN